MNASSETSFYLLELVKVVAPVIGIAFILCAAIQRYRAEPTPLAAWLSTLGALWLIITLAARVALSAPVRKYFLSAAMAQFDPEHLREPWYLAVASWLFAADEVVLLAFGVTLFLAWRANRIHLT